MINTSDSMKDRKKINFIKLDWTKEFKEINEDGNSRAKNNNLNRKRFKIKIKY